MSLNPILSLLQGVYTTVDVRFENPGKLYTYKTRIPFKRGDNAIVDVRGVLKLVEVVNVHHTPKIDYAATFEYQWIVQKVDTTAYEKVLEGEAELQNHFNVLDRLERKQALIDTFEKTYPEGSKTREYWFAKVKPLLKD